MFRHLLRSWLTRTAGEKLREKLHEELARLLGPAEEEKPGKKEKAQQ